MLNTSGVLVALALLAASVIGCEDKDEVCDWLKSQGYCERQFAEWMAKHCTKTCGKCGSLAATVDEAPQDGG